MSCLLISSGFGLKTLIILSTAKEKTLCFSWTQVLSSSVDQRISRKRKFGCFVKVLSKHWDLPWKFFRMILSLQQTGSQSVGTISKSEIIYNSINSRFFLFKREVVGGRGLGILVFQFHFHPLLAVWPRASYWVSLNFHFCVCEIVIIRPTCRCIVRVKCPHMQKYLAYCQH